MNRCGHNRANPVLNVPVKHRRLSIISKICEKVMGFYSAPGLLSGLNTVRARKLKQLTRCMRSERREAIVQVLNGLLTYTDLATMRVGFYEHDGFKPMGVRFFVKLTGLSQSRYERALADINAAGLITTYTRCRRDAQGAYIGLNAVRCISKELFDVFGLGKWLSKQRKKCSDKLFELAAAHSIEKIANLTMISKARSVGSRVRKYKNATPQKQAPPTRLKKMNNPHLQTLADILNR